MATKPARRGRVDRPSEGTLSEVMNTVVGKGLVIDVAAQASLIGIKAVAADVRIVVTSIDTSLRAKYLRLARAASRLGLSESESDGRPVVVENLAGRRKEHEETLEAGSEELGDILGSAEEVEAEAEHEAGARG